MTKKKRKKYNTEARLDRLKRYIKRIYGVTIRNIEDLLIFFDDEFPPPERAKHLPEVNRISAAVALAFVACDKDVSDAIATACREIFDAIAEETADFLGIDIAEELTYKPILTLSGDISADIKNTLTTAFFTDQNARERLNQLAERRANSWYLLGRTEATRAENSARFEIGQIAQKNGLKVVKQWQATHDDRTRETHAAKDGETLPLEALFIFLDGSKMLYPADDTHGASLSEIINCRCQIKVFTA